MLFIVKVSHIRRYLNLLLLLLNFSQIIVLICLLVGRINQRKCNKKSGTKNRHVRICLIVKLNEFKLVWICGTLCYIQGTSPCVLENSGPKNVKSWNIKNRNFQKFSFILNLFKFSMDNRSSAYLNFHSNAVK